MNRDEIIAELFRMQDKKYALMQTKIIPTVASDRIIGVRTPALRTFAKSLYKDPDVNEAFVFLSPSYPCESKASLATDIFDLLDTSIPDTSLTDLAIIVLASSSSNAPVYSFHVSPLSKL